MAILGIDISHHQGAPNFDSVRNAGVQFVIAKATESTSFVDPQFARTRSECHRVGLVFGAYHFARGGNAVTEANYFCDKIGGLQDGELVVLDWEIANPNPVGWSKSWLDQVTARTGVRPLIYLNSSTMNGNNWTPVVQGNYGLWLAKYDNSQAPSPIKWWSNLSMKQYWDKGNLAGMSPLDLDVFYGDRNTLLKYGKQGVAGTPSPVNVPAPTNTPTFNVQAWRAHFGDTGAIFVSLQNFLNRAFPAYSKIGPTSPSYGPQTAAVLAEMCRRSGVASDGRDIGPKTAALLYQYGFRG